MAESIIVFFQSLISLLAILDPIGSVPMFSSLTSKLRKKERIKVVNKSVLLSYVILIFFGFFGQFILIILGITMGDLKIIGGIILLVFSVEYVLGRNINYLDKNTKTNLAIFPLATPILAGPGSIGYVLVMSGIFLKLAVISVSLFICWITLRLGSGFIRLFGKEGSLAISRIMGLLIGAVAIRLIREGLVDLMII